MSRSIQTRAEKFPERCPIAPESARLPFEVRKREKPFIETWIAFLDELWDRGLLKVKHQSEEQFIWAGIGINSDNQSVRWSEAAVERFSTMLTLWWYFYMNEPDRPGAFMKALNQASGAAIYPNGKKALDSVTKGLVPLVKTGEKELSEKTIASRVEARLKILLACARSKSAQETPEEPDAEAQADAQVEAAIVETVKEVEASGDGA